MVLMLVCIACVAQAGPAVWPMDELTHTNGTRFLGRILEETPNGVRFQVVRRPAGRPTVTLTTTFSPKEIVTLKRISDAERATLKDRLAELDPTGVGERERMESLELKVCEWPVATKQSAKRYESELFTLQSTAPDEITRRVAVRLEQILTAYGRFLPPRQRTTAPTPTLILLAGDLDNYRRLLGPKLPQLLNPAVYDVSANRVVCGSDLTKLGSELTAARLHNVQQLGSIEKYEQQIRVLYKDSRQERERYLAAGTDERKRILVAERLNDAAFDAATARLFAILYHEAFHAYAANQVYPPRPASEVRAGAGTGALPRWLDEGLAQIFETAVLDGGELRVGHADRTRLNKLQDPSAKGTLFPLAELLRAGPESYLAAHAGQRTHADRIYLTTWATAFYLTFERRLIGTPAMDDYLVALNTGTDPIKAFEQFVGQDLPAFETDLQAYLVRLKPDGSLLPRK